ncbi:MAG: phosphopentomutase [Candidatus Hydrogenedentota bacterium]
MDMIFHRIFLVVIDGLGVGELPDSEKYGDKGSNTLVHILENVKKIKLPNMTSLGLGNILNKDDILPVLKETKGFYGKSDELNEGKDTVTGHWEMAGIKLQTPFRTYPNGFPEELLDEFSKRVGRAVIGNKAISGTIILDELGEEHIKTGALIVYTSADSVFQIAANEDIIPIDEQYKICKIARELLVDEYFVGRVIARPFVGNKKGEFKRTPNRKDFGVPLPKPNLLNNMLEKGYDVIGVGKIYDIFSGEGLSEYVKQKDNKEGLEHVNNYIDKDFTGLCFINLVDTDMKYGHRLDIQGFYNALEEIDDYVGNYMKKLRTTDLFIITGDHGCDPTNHTDHNREYIPILCYSSLFKRGKSLGTRKTFADIGQTIAENYDVDRLAIGKSFLPILTQI